MGQISIFHFITSKRHIRARFRVFWAIKRQNPSRGLFSTLVREKKSHTKSYISPLCPEVSRERIFTKFGTYTPLVDLINPGKLCDNLFKGFDFTGVKISIFPIRNWRRRYNSAALPRSLWWITNRKVCNQINLCHLRSRWVTLKGAAQFFRWISGKYTQTWKLASF